MGHILYSFGNGLRIISISSHFIFAIPTQYFFLYGMKFAVEELGEVWGARLMGFGLSYLIFPLLTYYYFGENMFAPKTLICVALSFAIVGIQVFWK